MTKELWINIPVKDVSASKEFFTELGFIYNATHSNADMAAFSVGSKKVNVMLFKSETFSNICGNKVADTKQGTEVLFSFDAESKEEVDEMATKVTNAGGNVFSKPALVQGWMYGCAFTDPDGHRWNILYMDMSKMQ